MNGFYIPSSVAVLGWLVLAGFVTAYTAKSFLDTAGGQGSTSASGAASADDSGGDSGGGISLPDITSRPSVAAGDRAGAAIGGVPGAGSRIAGGLSGGGVAGAVGSVGSAVGGLFATPGDANRSRNPLG